MAAAATLHTETRAERGLTPRGCAHLPIQLHGQDGVGVAVVADLRSLLEVANFQLPRSFEADDGHQAAREQSFHDAHVFSVSCKQETYMYPHQQAQAARTHEHVSKCTLRQQSTWGYTVGAW